MHKDKRVEKKKTITIKRCLNPVFNESFPFDIPAHVLRETTIIITVMDKDRLSRNDVIGKVLSIWCVASIMDYTFEKKKNFVYMIINTRYGVFISYYICDN